MAKKWVYTAKRKQSTVKARKAHELYVEVGRKALHKQKAH